MFPNPKTLARYSLLFASFIQSIQAAEFASLRHHWNFDEGPDWHDDPFGSIGSATVAHDALGASDASLMNGPRWVSGRQYSGLMLDGVDDYLELSNDLSPSLGGTASLSFWLKTTQTGAVTADAAPGLLGSGGVQWGWLDELGKIALSVDGAEPVRSAEAINDGEWHHVILMRDATSGELSVYLDGAMSATAVGPVGTRAGAISRIGHMQNGSGVYLRGRLDQIHVFNQPIGTETRQALFENHAPKVWPVHTDGETGGTFTTASVLINTYLYDAEQDTVTVTRHTQPRHGQVADRGDGSFNYTAAAGFTGQDAFDVWIHDGNGGYTRNTVNIRVTDAAQAGAAQRTTTFAGLQAIEAAGASIALSGWRVPRALDWDGDGDNDLLVGHSSGIWRYENIGSAEAAVFAAGVKVQAGAADISLSGSILIALADFTGDAVDDLVAVNSSREVRVYANTAAAGQPPVYAAESRIPSSAGGSFNLPDQRFDAADWDGDGLPDLITGTRSGNVLFHHNIGTATAPLFDPNQSVVLESGSYNLYPRIFDINRNGRPDCIRGINWGSISFWFDPAPATSLGGSDGSLTLTDASGAAVDIKALTDGAMVDFADMNGDGVLDVLIGGHVGSQVSVAFGVASTVADSLAAIETIYDTHASGLGAALEADGQSLLSQVNAAAANILMHAAASTLTERRQVFQLIAAHVAKYPFLQMAAPLDTNQYRHLPSIAGQILMTLHHLLPDSVEHRQEVADTMGLSGLHREIYLQMGLHVGDNQRASRGQLESIRDFMRLQPRESFPDAAITLDHYYGDGRGGWVSSFRGAKNTFNFGEGGNVSEWATDLNTAAESFFGSPVQKGDYFTFVMGHEVTHSLDGYISGRANEDLWRRKGQVMTLAAGPDVLTVNLDNHGYWDWNTTKARFQELGYWDGNSATWNQAWESYWSSGPGAAFESLSFMRGNIDWFLGAPQEAMATQANHHWAHAEARLTGAINRWLRGEKLDIDPMKANLTEVLTFLDWISCGMNRIVMHDTEGTSTPYNRALYLNTHAWLERDDLGRITRVSVDGRDYRFEVDTQGVTTAILKAPGIPVDDEVDALRDSSQLIRPLLNDAAGGGVISIASFTQPSHGTVFDEGNGVLRYEPDAGYSGSDEFTYLSDGAVRAGRVKIHVREPAESVPGATMETWTGLGGSSLVDLTSSPQFPHEPNAIELRADFSAPSNRGSNFGTRMTALIVPPESGDYTFWIASDDQSELWLGEDRSSVSRARIAWVDVWTDPNQWGKYPSQQSVAIPLIGGRPYYLEARHKEGGGGDNLSVSWQGPGMSRETITQAFLRTVDRHAPSLARALADVEMLENASASVIDLSGVFEDADFMDSLRLEVIANSNPGLISGSLQGESLLVSASIGRTGQATLTLRAEDLSGAVVTDELVVTVLADLDGDGISDIADPDDDGDGMPDSWEITHGLDPRIYNANSDDDGDGWSNLQEFVSETHPRNRMDRQQFWIENATESIVSLGFTTSSARRYTVQFRDSLDADSWSNLHEPIAGSGVDDFVNDAKSPFHARFYRLRVELP